MKLKLTVLLLRIVEFFEDALIAAGSSLRERVQVLRTRELQSELLVGKGRAVRWIETRGCMAHDHSVEHCVVTDVYQGLWSDNKLRSIVRIRKDNGEIFSWPLDQFTVNSEDGALEYRY